ncbi:MAG TPA: hypothetical protein VFI54_11605, partial [Solirubrobacteraceae bacterium]|nr:hypothetical protein [Solirubrobacteraceae bacterium]
GQGSRASLATWDAQLAAHGIALMQDRARAIDLIAASFARLATALGLTGDPELRYRPRSRAVEPAELVAELAERIDSDLERGFSGHGPHRDDVSFSCQGRELRPYGSQGQQRLALLSLLLAEREAIAASRDVTPVMLLDDVMSELDRDRREALVEVLRAGGQAVITTTDLEHVPGVVDLDVTSLVVAGGTVHEGAVV